MVAAAAASPALLPTAPSVILITLAFVCTLLLPTFWHNAKNVLGSPTTFLPVCLFLLLLTSALWADSSWQESLRYLKKYKEFLLLPVLVFAISRGDTRKYAVWSLYYSLALSALITFFIYLGWLEFSYLNWWQYTLYSRIFFGISTAFLAYWAYQLILCTTGRERWLHIAVIILALVDILLVTQGRTGYVVLATLAILEVIRRRRVLTKTLVIVGTLVLFTTAYGTSNHFRTRIDQSLVDIKQYFTNHNNQSSIGIRLDFYKNTLNVIRENTVFGSGIGDFADDYARLAPGNGAEEVKNPHNEYLMLAATAGIPATLLFIAWLAVLMRHALRYQKHQLDGTLLLGAVTTIIVSCLFNSSFLDSRDGAFFLLLIAVFLNLPKLNFRPVFFCDKGMTKTDNNSENKVPDTI